MKQLTIEPLFMIINKSPNDVREKHEIRIRLLK